MATSGFECMECGHKFRTIKAAERAAFGSNGCPKCGSSDIDLGPRLPVQPPAVEHIGRVDTVDVMEHEQPVTYQSPACSCGWKGETTYIGARAWAQLEDHALEVC